MSRSNQTETNPNPAKMFFKFASSKGAFQYYDKEKKENIVVKLPFRFMVLDTLSTVGGFSKNINSGFWANEVRNTTTDPLIVRTKDGVFAEGLYRDKIEAPLKADGGKFVQSIYIAYKDESKELIIANIQMMGSALGAWIPFTKANRQELFKGVVTVKTTVEEKNGANTYQVPVFKIGTVTEPTDAAAKLLDEELQVYLNEILSTPKSSNPAIAMINATAHELVTAPPAPVAEIEEDDDDLPF
jgi:hypothetical protein